MKLGLVGKIAQEKKKKKRSQLGSLFDLNETYPAEQTQVSRLSQYQLLILIEVVNKFVTIPRVGYLNKFFPYVFELRE